MKLCFATNNQHKLDEVKRAIGESVQLLSLKDIGCSEELPETRDTLEGNSLQKAEYVFANYGVACFADDSGLEVDILQGAPGVYSARYAGNHRSDEDNISLLLSNLENASNRTARFRTVITLIGISQEPVFFDGIVKGHITTEKRGTSGFGYDPVFVPEGLDLTFAEMSIAEKNRLSHRGLAVEELKTYLKSLALKREK